MYESLYKMTFAEQMQNIGAEVSRALRFKDSGNQKKAEARLSTAVDMMRIMSEEYPTRKKEFDFLEEELSDYIHGCILYDSSNTRIQKEFDCFLAHA